MMKQREDLDEKYVNGHFDRQVRIEDWNQEALEKQTALVLGIGGLGSVTLIGLLRLGIRKVIIVDYDVVDNHNMNRQIIYSVKDIGKKKVDCAKINAQFHNCNRTQIEAFHGDALKNWPKIVAFTQQADVVFNCIDHGDRFDVAMSSLCIKYKKPLIMGGTFSTSLTVDFFNPEGAPCFLCTNDEAARDVELIRRIVPQKISQLEDISFLPKNNNPIGRSSTIVCTICGQYMISQYINWLFLENRPLKPVRMIGYHNTGETITFVLEANRKCAFCGDPEYVEPKVEPEPILDKVQWNCY